ncbi:hypothetical protein Tco_1299267, partial [Tanacetum coccineum]
MDFDNENPAPSVTEGTVAEGGTQDGLAHEEPPEETATTTKVAKEAVAREEMASVKPLVSKRRKQLRRKRGNEEVEVNTPPKVLMRDHASGPTQSTTGGKSLASMGSEAGIPIHSVGDPCRSSVAGDPESEKSSSFTSIIGSPGGIYQSGWGVTNNCHLDTSDVCQDVVDHIVLPGYFSELRHLPNNDFLSQYNINLARQVAMGSQLRLRFEQEVRLRKRATEKIAKQEQRIQAREEEIKSQGGRKPLCQVKTLLEAEVDMKKATEARNADLAKEAQVTSEEKIKAAFKEFKSLEDEKVKQRCAEIDARLDALSIDFDEELYPHMLTAIAGRRWVIGHSLRLAVMKCAESIDLRQAFADVVSAGIVK